MPSLHETDPKVKLPGGEPGQPRVPSIDEPVKTGEFDAVKGKFSNVR